MRATQNRELPKAPAPFKTAFLIILIFVLLITLSDALLSYWVPIYIEKTVGNTATMGLILAFSSVIGLIADIYLPQIIKTINIPKLMLVTIAIVCTCILSLSVSHVLLPVLLILVGVGFWGIYYELIGFTTALFLAKFSPTENRSEHWGILYAVKSFTYMVGPLLASFILISQTHILIYSLLFTALAIVPAFVAKIRPFSYHLPHTHEKHTIAQAGKEMRYWWTLFKRIWPIVILSFWIGVIDASFWTIGPLWTVKLTQISPWGGLFLSVYASTSIIAGIVLARWIVYKRKKYIAELLTTCSGILLMGIGLTRSISSLLLLTFIASLLLALAIPLIDAVFTDITARMHGNKQHMIGLSYSTNSLAYIVGPIIAGLITFYFKEQMTFYVIGALTTFLGIFLLFVTPRKLQLPQKEIETWKS